MGRRKKLHIGMSLAPTWLSGDAWRRPDSNIEAAFDGDFYVDVAKRSEAAKLDFVFRPDSLFLHTQVLETAPGFASLDPTVLLAMLARETSQIGLASTVSTMFMPPYVLARQIMSLHRLSGGRAGWNIVTALDGNENFGLDAMPSSEERYERALECVSIVRQLWESFPEAALKRDRETGVYAETKMIRSFDHEGKHFKVKGPLNLPGLDHAPVPFLQAGASESGRDFAASVADAVFAATPDMQAAQDLRQDLNRRAQSHGRIADDIRLLAGLGLYLAPTRAEARDLFAFTHARADRGRKLSRIQKLVGLDLSEWPQDRQVTLADLPAENPAGASKTHAALIRRMIARNEPLLSELLNQPEVNGPGHWQIVGTAEDAAREIAEWFAAGAIDGFIAAPGGAPGSLSLVLDELVPRLREAGLFREDYAGETFASHLAEQV